MTQILLQIACRMTPELAGERLDKALVALVGQDKTVPLSRARLQALIADGHVSRMGALITNTNHKVKADETYTLNLPPPEPATPQAESIALNVVYEDDDLLVLDKPAGFVVHPAPGHREGTLVNALLAHCGDTLSGIGGVARPGIVHRLDKDTSGLMVVAKNDTAHQKLSRQFADRTLSRTYHAVVRGVPMPYTGSIDAPIGRHSTDRKKMAVTGKGRAALTHYKVIKIFEKDGKPVASLVECKLSTGRTHQIRVHLAHLKHPVIGDPVYGKADKIPFPRQALHAVALQFQHPRTDKIMRFTSALPEDMKELVEGMKSS